MTADPRLDSARLHADVERLRAQASLSWPLEQRALIRLGLRDGMSILEVGSGPGFITELLLRHFPTCTVVAVELDPTMCELARARLACFPQTRWQVVEASILNTDLPDQGFDFALARLVLQHLAAPEFALHEILRLLEPGARLAILDVDDDLGGLLVPYLSEFALVAQKVRQVQAGRAGDREIGRKLWRLLSAAGYTELALETVVFHSDDLGLEPFLPQYRPERYRPFVIPGGLTPAEWQAYGTAYQQFLAAPDAFILQLMLLASGKRPASVSQLLSS